MSGKVDVDAAAREHHDRVTFHDYPLKERRARMRELAARRHRASRVIGAFRVLTGEG